MPRCSACRQSKAIFPFTMAFQPIVDLKAQSIDSQEALVRGPEQQSAYHVLSQLNDDNRYAFDQSCRVKAIELAARLGLQGQLNINFLPNAVYEPKGCIKLTLETAARHGWPLDKLTFEFTEQESMADTNHVLAIIAEYRRHGFKIALDDFATSYSGLARLADLRPDIIKLDRCLMKDIDIDRNRRVIVANLVRMSQELGIKVVAEGVERREEVDAARAIGIQFMQGFYFAKPSFERVQFEADINWPMSRISKPMKVEPVC